MPIRLNKRLCEHMRPEGGHMRAPVLCVLLEALERLVQLRLALLQPLLSLTPAQLFALCMST